MTSGDLWSWSSKVIALGNYAADFMTLSDHWTVWSWQLIGTVRLSQDATSVNAFKDSVCNYSRLSLAESLRQNLSSGTVDYLACGVDWGHQLLVCRLNWLVTFHYRCTEFDILVCWTFIEMTVMKYMRNTDYYHIIKSNGHKVLVGLLAIPLIQVSLLVLLLPILSKSIVNNPGCLCGHKENSSFITIQLMPQNFVKISNKS